MSQSPIARSQYSLAGTPLLAGLPAEALEQIEGRCSWRRYEPGEPIVEYLDRSNDVFFLCEGEARVIIYSMSGKVVSFHDLVPGDMFGEYPAIDGRPRSASVEARTSCLVALMPAAAFRDLVQSEPAVTQALLKQLVATIRRLSTRVYEFSAHIMAITARRIYAEMQGIRAKDTYPDEEVKAYLVEKTFPKSAEEMTLKLSNVSAAFYGLMLAHIGDRFGWREADTISKAVFKKLGQLKTREALELGVDVPKDFQGSGARVHHRGALSLAGIQLRSLRVPPGQDGDKGFRGLQIRSYRQETGHRATSDLARACALLRRCRRGTGRQMQDRRRAQGTRRGRALRLRVQIHLVRLRRTSIESARHDDRCDNVFSARCTGAEGQSLADHRLDQRHRSRHRPRARRRRLRRSAERFRQAGGD